MQQRAQNVARPGRPDQGHQGGKPQAERAPTTQCPPLRRCRVADRRTPPPCIRPHTNLQVFREVKFFGDAEISTLKKDLEAHKLQLEQLKQVWGTEGWAGMPPSVAAFAMLRAAWLAVAVH